jgi:deoxyadenosine/deoxycytidine kinase
MPVLISFEGCIGAGKTTLTNYFSKYFKAGKLLEAYGKNPFLKEFYKGFDVKFETELSFLLIHYQQLKNVLKNCKKDLIFADFSIEKDIVFAKLNLNKKEYKLFERVYKYITKNIGIPYKTIYLDLSFRILKRRMLQRGRKYELNMDLQYLEKYNKKIKRYFRNVSNNEIHFFNVDDLNLRAKDRKLEQIKKVILK